MLVRWLCTAAVLALAVGLALPALAADEAQVLRMRAEQLAAEGRCDEAIENASREGRKTILDRDVPEAR